MKALRLGSSVTGIVKLLSGGIIKLVLLGNVIAIPIAYYGTNEWLASFAYHTDPGIVTFIAAGMMALVVAIMTISYHSLKAALANPVDSLKYE